MQYKTLQSVFDVVWHEFVVHDAPQAIIGSSGVSPMQVCEYRTNNGQRCFIGVCIPKDRYMDALEASSIVSVEGKFPGWYKDLFNGVDSQTLSRLQNIHDHWIAPRDVDTPHLWKRHVTERLTEFAAEHNLTIKEPV